MKLSIEINDKVKVLLLELLQDQDIKHELAKIAHQELSNCILYEDEIQEQIQKAVENQSTQFMTEDQVQETVTDTLRNATFFTECEG